MVLVHLPRKIPTATVLVYLISLLWHPSLCMNTTVLPDNITSQLPDKEDEHLCPYSLSNPGMTLLPLPFLATHVWRGPEYHHMYLGYP